jgi:hypothetical protein
MPGNTSLTWPHGAQVEVIFDNSVSPERRAIYEQVLDNWTYNNGQGVRFNYGTEQQNQPYSMLISDAVPSDTTERGDVYWQQYDANGVLQYVKININPGVTDPTALANAMSHETAHNFGLNHTQDGSLSNLTASSLYNLSIGLNDTTTGAPGPTPCDQQVINSTYAAGGVKNVSLTHELLQGGGGGGGSDDEIMPFGSGGCTPYYWVFYESYDQGQTWQATGGSEYAGCW